MLPSVISLFFKEYCVTVRGQDSTVSTATGCGPDDRGVVVYCRGSYFHIWSFFFFFQNTLPSFTANHVSGYQPSKWLGGWDGFSRSQGPGTSIPRNASTPTLESKVRDPFADLGE
jgi:hypothetical protein